MQLAPPQDAPGLQPLTEGLLTRCTNALERLAAAWRHAPLACFDRRDFQGHPLMLRWLKERGQGRRGAALAVKLVNALAFLAPATVRVCLGQRRHVYAGALAFLIAALEEWQRLEPDAERTAWIGELLPQLLALKCGRAEAPGWGLPFDWHSFSLVRAGTPLGYTTALAAEAFLLHYLSSGSALAAAEAAGACRFLATQLNRSEHPGGGIALSYTWQDWSSVANTNSLIAAVLLECGAALGTGEWNELGCAIARYVLGAQQADGSWCYAEPGSIIDHYHTSMTMLGLVRVLRCPAAAELHQPIEAGLRRGLHFHLTQLWTGPIPRHDTKQLYPVEALGPAEALILFGYLWPLRDRLGSELSGLLEQRWVATLSWLLPQQFPDGTFPMVFYRWRNQRLRSLRWADAQFMRGLALSKAWLRGCL